MDRIGLVDSINKAAMSIDLGRRGFAIHGKEREGRILYEDGISKAMATFQKAQASVDPNNIILAEYTFLSQELQLCDKSDKDTLSSLTKAVQSFDDAFFALQAVEEPGYKTAEKTYPHSGKYRVSGFPKDAFHTACISHKTRLQNILRVPGIDTIEKTLLKQRFANLPVAQDGYMEKQGKALSREISLDT